MGLLDEQLAIDGAMFVDDDSFGESVTYTPVTGAAATIRAVVHRMLPDDPAGSAPALTPVFEIWIRNDATLGRTTIDRGGDTITFSGRVGAAAEAYSVVDVMDQDNGMWHLQVR